MFGEKVYGGIYTTSTPRTISNEFLLGPEKTNQKRDKQGAGGAITVFGVGEWEYQYTKQTNTVTQQCFLPPSQKVAEMTHIFYIYIYIYSTQDFIDSFVQ